MKKIFTLCFGLVAALALKAQSDFPLQFADSEGNIIADGTTLNITEFEADAFGDVIMRTKLFVKNTTGAAVQGGGTYTIQTMNNGVFQTCFPANCVRQTAVGNFTTSDGEIAPGELKDMQTEWFPSAEGACQVVYQLITFKQNPVTKKFTKDKSGPSVTLKFAYGTSGIDATTADNKQACQVEYYNQAGCRVLNPSRGLYIVKTTYADGSIKSKKHFIQ